MQFHELLRQRQPDLGASCRRVAAPSTCSKRSKMRSKSSRPISGPVSRTATSAQHASTRSRRPTDTNTLPPSGVNFNAFESRFETAFSTWLGSNGTEIRLLRPEGETEAPALGQRRERVGKPPDEIHEIQSARVEREFAVLDAG